MNKHDILAFDKSSVRSFDENGNLHVSISPLTRVQVAPYWGREIPGYEELKLDPEKIYYGYRPAEELSSPETIKSVEGIPIQLMHHIDLADEPAKDTRIGSTGDKAEFKEPYLYNSLHFQDKKAIDRIEDNSMRELSLAYAYEPDFTAGQTPSGQKYDFVMRKIRANHVALVENGRAGPSVLVFDHALNGENSMTKRRKLATDSDVEKKEVDSATAIKDAAQDIIDLHQEQGGDVTDKDEGASDGMEDVSKALADAGVPEDKIPEVIAKIKASLGGQDEDPAAEDEDEEPTEGEDPEDATADEDPEDVTEDEDEPDTVPSEDEDPEDAAEDEDDNEQLITDGLKSCGLDAENEELRKGFSEGVKYGESLIKDPEERKKVDSEHESEGAKKAMGQDAAFISRQVESRMNRKFAAIDECKRSIGKVKAHAFDSAGAVYKAALKAEGISTKGLSDREARTAYRAYMAGKKRSSSMAEDSAIKRKESGIGSILKNINRGY